MCVCVCVACVAVDGSHVAAYGVCIAYHLL